MRHRTVFREDSQAATSPTSVGLSGIRRRTAVHQLASHLGEIQGGPPVGHLHATLARQRLKDHKQIGRSVPFIFVIHPRRTPRRGGNRPTCFLGQLPALLVKTHDRPLGIAGPLVDFEHVFHRADKIGVLLGRQHPLLFAPGLKHVFFSVVRTASRPIDSTISSSTSLSASSCIVQHTRPGGGEEQAKATKWASWTPSSLRYCRFVAGLRYSDASKPSSTNCCRTRWTVDKLTPSKSTIASSTLPGPSCP